MRPKPITRSTISIIVVFSAGSYSVALGAGPPKLGTRVGEMYPDSILPTLDGKYGHLSDYRGKKVLLIHFASW